MSAPNTNIKKQEKRHAPSLFGIGIAVAFAAILLAVFVMFIVGRGEDPEGADVQIDSRTGDTVSGDDGVSIEPGAPAVDN